jgi:hypothetical protein
MKTDFEKSHQWRIQRIDPEHGRIGMVYMLMPSPVWIGEKISLLHIERLAFHYAPSTFAADYEPDTGLRVTVRDRMLSRLEHLQVELKGMGRGSLGGTA